MGVALDKNCKHCNKIKVLLWQNRKFVEGFMGTMISDQFTFKTVKKRKLQIHSVASVLSWR